ncbi:uncharacterized protein EV154DRAFT_556956 [Mucor mucedo]|uniref:uncharacterized protein n=1 Tax=Mucor mucedo TaxID=29922 RepID=UPI00221F9B97|nr:uncharacterized protein EV154DRAFT_556956 [Mucor mucedo]KAI7867617.1 hypothetical protein EV154DRAFT_556956 [Mucor mucedo]
MKIAKQELDHIRMGYIATNNTNNATLENLLQILFIYIILRIYLPVLLHLQYIPFAIEPFGDTHLFTMYPKSCAVNMSLHSRNVAVACLSHVRVNGNVKTNNSRVSTDFNKTLPLHAVLMPTSNNKAINLPVGTWLLVILKVTVARPINSAS